MGSRLRQSLISGLLAAVLALPLLGVELVETGGGLVLHSRLEVVVWVFAAAAVGTFALKSAGGLSMPRIALPAWTHKSTDWMGWALALFAVALPFLPFADRSLLDRATLILIYVMLGWGLNVVVGWAGLLDLGYAGFYAIGAYSYALLAQAFDVSFWLCLPLAGLLSALFGIALGFPVLRLRGDYLAIVTLGFGEIIRIILLNWQDLTGGPNGISNIKRPTLFGLSFSAVAPEGGRTFSDAAGIAFAPEHRIIFLYFLILALALLTNFLALRLRRLPIGRAWEALREDEIACRSLGINPTNVKLSAFAIGAMCAGFAGSFFATRQGFITPESFTFIESAVIVAIVVLGGLGTQVGIVFAAIILVGLPEWFRELQNYRMLVFGLTLLAVMIFKPSGLVSKRSPTILLKEAE